MPQPQHYLSVVPFAVFERPSCSKCRASMRVASITPVGGVDLHSFECAVCNFAIEILAAHEDPKKSNGYWLQGHLRPVK